MPRISVIVPTLNEGRYIGNLLTSLEKQDYRDFEVIVVDGGSTDKTLAISEAFGAHTLILPKCREYPSRNKAAETATGDILLFTGADVIFPEDLLHNIVREFENPKLLAVAGPGIPYDARLTFKTMFFIYNSARWFFAHLPRPFKRFSSSTNLLAVRKEAFEAVGGIDSKGESSEYDVNADGMLGKKLCANGLVRFSFFRVRAYASARRITSMGGVRFTIHFLYVLENFFPFLSRSALIRKVKDHSGQIHSQMRMKDAADSDNPSKDLMPQ